MSQVQNLLLLGLCKRDRSHVQEEPAQAVPRGSVSQRPHTCQSVTRVWETAAGGRLLTMMADELGLVGMEYGGEDYDVF